MIKYQYIAYKNTVVKSDLNMYVYQYVKFEIRFYNEWLSRGHGVRE